MTKIERFYELATDLSTMLTTDAKQLKGQTGDDLVYACPEGARQTLAMLGEMTALIANAVPPLPMQISRLKNR